MSEHVSTKVSRTTFLVTSSVLLGVCLVSTLVRFYIRGAVQKQFGWDDGWLIFGVCCLVAGMAILYTMLDLMYEMEAIAASASSAPPIPDISLLPPEFVAQIAALITKSVRYRKLSAAACIPLWSALCSVKFSFLALFKKLVRQMPVMTRYWWFVLAFNIAISLYGSTVFIISCPYFEEKNIMKSLQCTSGAGLATNMNHAMAQMVLDIAGDLFILAIPFVLLWQIRIPLSQKIALGLTLCLTIVMIIITAVRIIGLKHNGKLDYIWEIFLLAVAGEIGIILVAVTAFRALYVSRVKGSNDQMTASFNWYYKSKSAVRKLFSSVSGKSRATSVSRKEPENRNDERIILGRIPRGTMTGVHTFMGKNGVESVVETDNPSDSVSERRLIR